MLITIIVYSVIANVMDNIGLTDTCEVGENALFAGVFFPEIGWQTCEINFGG